MLTEKRIQVYLPEREYRAIRARAREEGKSLAGLLRDAARRYVALDERDRLREGHQLLEGLIGIAHDKEGKTDVAENHDLYLNQGPQWKW